MNVIFGGDKARGALQEAKARGEFIELATLSDFELDSMTATFRVMETVAEDFNDMAELEIARRNLRELYAEQERRKSAQEG